MELGQDEDDADSMGEAAAELDRSARRSTDLEVHTLLAGEYDEREAVVTIRAGAGGVDAADFAEMLLRMYLRWAEQHGYPTTIMDTSYAEEAGIKSATFEVDAPYAFGTLSVEAGTHRLVRISPFDNQGRRQTSLRRGRGHPADRADGLASRSRRTTSASTSSARPAPAASRSTPPTPRCA